MIDWDALAAAYAEDRVYAVQLEVGDRCEQGCSYCYMNALPEARNTLSTARLETVLEDAAGLGVTAVEWLGGEPLLREGVFALMGRARKLGLRNNVWTGGLPLADREVLEETAVAAENGLISVHCSTVDPALYRRLHPGRDERDLAAILDAVETLLELGYPPSRMLNSVTLTGVQGAADMVRTVDHFEREYGVTTSLNVYHTYLRPGQGSERLAEFIPSVRDVARVYARLGRQYGGPLPMNCVDKHYCSATVAVLADGSVTPCATIRDPEAPSLHRDGGLAEIFGRQRDHLVFKPMKTGEALPERCRSCDLADSCFGCRSRAWAAGLGLYGPDPRCFRGGG